MARDFKHLGKDIRRLAAKIERFSETQATTIMGVEAVKGTRRNFQVEGMIRNGSVNKWKPKKKPNNKRVLHKRGNLKAAVRYWKQGKTVRVGVDGSKIPYAEIHQDGGTIKRDGYSIEIPQRKYLELTPDIIKSITRKINLRLDKLKP